MKNGNNLTDLVSIGVDNKFIRNITLADAVRLATLILGWAIEDQDAFGQSGSEVFIQTGHVASPSSTEAK